MRADDDLRFAGRDPLQDRLALLALGAPGQHFDLQPGRRTELGKRRVMLPRQNFRRRHQHGLPTRLDLAFSRDQTEKIYVQQRMLEAAAELWSWLEAGAHFYVCGDASRMAKDVDAALHQIIETAGQKSPAEAAAYVASLKSAKRYQRDVY
eukprot:gene5068-biopygen4218